MPKNEHTIHNTNTITIRTIGETCFFLSNQYKKKVNARGRIFGNTLSKKSFCNERVLPFVFKDNYTYELIKAPITVSPIIVATRAIISELS